MILFLNNPWHLRLSSHKASAKRCTLLVLTNSCATASELLYLTSLVADDITYCQLESVGNERFFLVRQRHNDPLPRGI